jgi:hypothetical protein
MQPGESARLTLPRPQTTRPALLTASALSYDNGGKGELMTTQAVANANVQSYLQRLAQLYDDVRSWMCAFEPSSQFSETDIELLEEATGRYTARMLEIARLGRPAIQLVPRGRYMLGGEGRVDVKSRLGREILVWIRAGGPEVAFRFSAGSGEAPEELSGRPMFPGIAEGWAWSDEDRGELLHLDQAVFRDRILSSIGDA